MIALMLTALADVPVEAPATVAVQAIFEDIPEKKQRLKAVRYAMKKQRTIIGGRDWGRALCFRFRGERDVAVVEKALEKAGLSAELREAEDCTNPPREAFLPPKPKASRLVRVGEGPTEETLRAEVAVLLDLDLGVSAVRIQPGVVDRVCLEFDREPDPIAVEAALQTLRVPIQGNTPVEDCAAALKAP